MMAAKRERERSKEQGDLEKERDLFFLSSSFFGQCNHFHTIHLLILFSFSSSFFYFPPWGGKRCTFALFFFFLLGGLQDVPLLFLYALDLPAHMQLLAKVSCKNLGGADGKHLMGMLPEITNLL